MRLGWLALLWSSIALAQSPPRKVDLRGVFIGEVAAPRTVGRLAIQLIGPRGVQRVPPGHAFSAGDQVRFAVSTNQPGYLTIFHGGTDGRFTRLWPAEGASEAGAVRPGMVQVFPRAPHAIIFDGQPGSERFLVVVSAEQRADPSPAPARAPASSATTRFRQIRLRTPALVAAAKTGASEYADGHVYFADAADRGAIAALLVELKNTGVKAP